MAKPLIVLICVIAFFSCQQKADLLNGKVWYPVKVESNNSSTSMGLYALEFGSDAKLTTYTVGTQHKVSSTYNRTGNEIILNSEQDSIKVTFTASENKLVINFDTTTTVFYSDVLRGGRNDLTIRLDKILVSKSWELNSDLIEFHHWLNKGLIKPELQEELNNATLHFKNDNYYHMHEDFTWGSNYFNGINFLTFGNTTGHIENHYLIIESVTDTLIMGYKYDFQGQPQKLQLLAADDNKLTSDIIGNWNLSSYEEIPSEFNELWGTFGTEEGINISDLSNKALSFTFSSDSSYRFSTSNKTISAGKWHSDKSGRIIYLVAEYEDQDGLHYRTTYLSIISLTNTELIIHKKEDIIQANAGEFERKEYIETYKKVVTSAKKSIGL